MEKAGDVVIRYKTGLIGVDDRTEAGKARPSIGWLVGWAEKAGQQTVFALNIDIREPRHTAARMTLTKQLLGDIGAI
jgi:beta-lactamase class D